MKRFVALFLCVCCITLLLSGCNQPPADSPDENTSGHTQNTQSTTQPTTQPTESTTQPTEPVIVEDIEGPLAQYVQTTMKETLKMTNSKYGNKDESTPVRIPRLLPFSEDAITVQAEIQEEFDEIITYIRNNHAEGFGTAYDTIDYNAYLNHSVFSLVIYLVGRTDAIDYRVYNFDTTTGKRLDTPGLMSKLQIADYGDIFAQVAKQAYEEKYAHYQDKDDFYYSQLATTVSKENIDKAMPYVAEDGKVMVVIGIHPDGKEDYYAVNLSDK